PATAGRRLRERDAMIAAPRRRQRISRISRRSRSRSGCRCADPVAQAGDAHDLGAVLTAEERAVLLQPVPDDMDAAVLAGRCQRVDRAFEAVEGVRRAVHAHLKRLVVIVAAGFTSRHGDLATRWGWSDNPRAVVPVPGGRATAREHVAPNSVLL